MTLTDITFILDRSGSMSNLVNDVQGGLRNFVKEQKEIDGESVFTLVQFDYDYDVVFAAEDMSALDITTYKFVPRGSTALLDALGRTISETKARISALPKSERPDNVLFVIFTDGQENSSKEFTKEQIRTLIEKRSNKGWDFVYMGANQDAFAEANQIGIMAGSTVNFAGTEKGMQASMDMISSNVGQYRTGTRSASNMFDGATNVESSEDE